LTFLPVLLGEGSLGELGELSWLGRGVFVFFVELAGLELGLFFPFLVPPPFTFPLPLEDGLRTESGDVGIGEKSGDRSMLPLSLPFGPPFFRARAMRLSCLRVF